MPWWRGRWLRVRPLRAESTARRLHRRLARVLPALATVLVLGAPHAAPQAAPLLPAWVSCPTPSPMEAGQTDALLQLSALVQAELDARAAPVALISRSGLDLRPLGHALSHSGWLLPQQGWTVRQLYLDCQQIRPRIFDEGLAGFVRGVSADALPRLSVVWWPEQAAAGLARTVADPALAVSMVRGAYRAQAHAWSVDTINCNQWLLEMLAAAFGGVTDRAGAQQWLAAAGYQPSAVELPWWGWLAAAAVVPHAGLADHPPQDLQQLRFRTSLPASVEAFVARRWPGAERLQWCLRGRTVVLRRGWQSLDEDCRPGPDDELRELPL